MSTPAGHSQLMKRVVKAVRILAALFVTPACGVPDHSPWMRTGEDCMRCHDANGRASSTWTAAGTVYDNTGKTGAQGAMVLIVDARGTMMTLVANGSGNFYTGETLVAPFQSVGVSNGSTVSWMPQGYAPSGACNSCHVPGGVANKVIVTP